MVAAGSWRASQFFRVWVGSAGPHRGALQPLDLAGLRVVGPGVAEPDAHSGELAFQCDPAAAAVEAGKYGAVISEHPLGQAVPGHG